MIYFLQCEEAGPIKIGHTRGFVVGRLNQLQQSSPYRLRVIGLHDGAHADEQRLHKQFSEFRFRNEWFHPAEPIFKHISENGGLKIYDRLCRNDLSDAICREAQRAWTAEQRRSFREMTSGMSRYFLWREGRSPMTPKMASRIEEFLSELHAPKEIAA